MKVQRAVHSMASASSVSVYSLLGRLTAFLSYDELQVEGEMEKGVSELSTRATSGDNAFTRLPVALVVSIGKRKTHPLSFFAFSEPLRGS